LRMGRHFTGGKGGEGGETTCDPMKTNARGKNSGKRCEGLRGGPRFKATNQRENTEETRNIQQKRNYQEEKIG